MQIIQPYLGVDAPLLGARNYLGMKNGFLLDSHNYNPYLGVFKPLTNYSQLLGGSKHKPLIDQDVWNDDFLEIVDFIPQQDNQETTSIIYNLLSDSIESNINTEISEPVKNQKKSPSKSKSKSQTKTKPKIKSSPTAKKRANSNSSVAKQIEQSLSENSTSINLDDDRLLKTEDFLPVEPNYNNILIHESLIESEEENRFIPLIKNLPQIEDTDIFSSKLANNETILNFPNIETLEESLTEESENINLPNNINKSSETKPFLSTPREIDFLDNYKLSRELTNNEQLVTPQSIVMPIIQASESDILTTSTTPKDSINQLSETTLNPSLIEKESTIFNDLTNDAQVIIPEVSEAINPTHQQQENITETSVNEFAADKRQIIPKDSLDLASPVISPVSFNFEQENLTKNEFLKTSPTLPVSVSLDIEETAILFTNSTDDEQLEVPVKPGLDISTDIHVSDIPINPTVQNQGFETECSTNEFLENTSLFSTDENFPEISTNNTEENFWINDDKKDEFRENFTQESIHQIPDKVITLDAANISVNSPLSENIPTEENFWINDDKKDEFRENFTQESIRQIPDKVITLDAANISVNSPLSENFLDSPENTEENSRINDDKKDEFTDNFTQESIHQIPDEIIRLNAANISETTSQPNYENTTLIENLQDFAEISTNNTEENSRINDDKKDEFRENFTQEFIHQIANKVIPLDVANISENIPDSLDNTEETSRINDDRKDEFTEHLTQESIHQIPDEISTLNSPISEHLPDFGDISTIFEDLPAPIGLATGGLVASSNTISPLIAPSDTVPAMLTPGEFVINARDAQKNINFLRHINSGAALPEEVISQPSQESEATSETLPTKADTFKSSSVQRKSSNSLVSPLLGTEIENHSLSKQNSLQFNNFEDSTNISRENSSNYSSPPMIFRQSTNTTQNKPPSQWSSVEELLNGGTDEFSMFNFEETESSKPNSESPKILTKRLSSLQGFADGGEVVASDIATNIEPITETIERPSQLQEKEEGEESADLETLAMEIYGRLRQRLEIERERHGIYLGRLPW